MEIDRRSFIVGSAFALAAGRMDLAQGAEGAGEPLFASACRRADGSFAIAVLTEGGKILRELPLSARGHDISLHRPSGKAVAFARRPGFFAAAFDIDGRGEPQIIAPMAGRHYFGHGVFSRDGRLLYASEHNIETGDGLIGVYDVADRYRRIGEFASHGIGPHETILLADGVTLAIANGGIATDPTTGRENIDVPDMRPSLAFVDVRTGDLKALHELPADRNLLSIRHIAADGKGRVWFGGQWQGSLGEAPELIGHATVDRPIEIMRWADPLGVTLKGYIGSVAVSRDGRCLAASAPRAGRVVYVDTETSAIRSETALADGCGVAGVSGEIFALSSGQGVVRVEKPGEAPLSVATVTGTEFDNHLRLIV